MRVGLSYWGLLADFEQQRYITIDTPDGHRYGRPILVNALKDRAHDVYAMQRRREPVPFPGVTYTYDEQAKNASPGRLGDELFPELDVLFLEWRWPTWKNDPTHRDHKPDRFEPDLQRQLECIEYYRGKCPIIAWDTDLKVTLDDERAFPEIIWTDPSLRTNRILHPRASIPFWTDWKELLPVRQHEGTYGYVGNNYERPGEFQSYYFTPPTALRKLGIQTKMYGNWLQESPEREKPSTLVRCNEHVGFEHRMNFHDSMVRMNAFACTTHVSKQRYYETGFISPRYLEVLAVNCPGFVPEGMTQAHGHLLGEWSSVRPGLDVANRVAQVAGMPLAARVALLLEQRKALRAFGKFGVDHVVALIESHASR